MIEVFKFGNHSILGMSGTYYKEFKTHQIIMTLAIFHLIIEIPKNGFKLGFQIGNHQLYAKIDIGID